jgi:hypothetical protein
VERANRAVDLGAEVDPYSHAYGLFHSGLLHLWRSEPHLVDQQAVRLLELVADHDFPIWRALGMCLAGAANSLLGHPAEGLAQIHEGMDQYHGMRSPAVFWPFLRAVEAACLAAAGRLTDALTVLDEVLEWTGDLAAAAIFLVLRGDLALAVGDTGSARESYQHSRDMAHRADAVMLQLQAEVRLCRLRRGLGEVDDGGALRAVYDRFAEGFATRDLIEARELLAGPG